VGNMVIGGLCFYLDMRACYIILTFSTLPIYFNYDSTLHGLDSIIPTICFWPPRPQVSERLPGLGLQGSKAFNTKMIDQTLVNKENIILDLQW